MALLQDVPTWTAFLREAGIPTRESAAYARIFVDNRVNEKTISDLTADHLRTLEITILGDILAILRHAKTLSMAATQESTTRNPANYRLPSATVKLPSIIAEMTHPQFRKFRIDWDVYKKITGFPTAHVGPLLYSACDSDVQTSISTSSTFFDLDEDAMLKAIELIVTKRVNPTVHRMNFSNISQHENETVQDFLTRLCSSAVDCEFLCPECEHDISRVNIMDQFVQGIFNETLQTDILAKASQLKSVEDVVKHAEAFEAALRDQSQLHSSSDAHAARISDYRRSKNHSKYSKPQQHQYQQQQPQQHQYQQQQQETQSCSGCGSTSHGIMGGNQRSSHCPAWNKTCSACKRPNHFAAVCRNKTAPAAYSLVAHVKYDSDDDLFTSPDTLQEIPVNVTPDIKNSKTVTINIFPDSGANICLAGPKQLHEMGLTVSQLRPTRKRVKAVGGSQLICTGWLPIKFEIDVYNTTQPVFFCEKVDKLYFGKAACIDMKILPPSYPMPMTSNTQISSSNAISSTELVSVKRTPPPTRPNCLPFAPISENVPQLKQYIVKSFASSAFNSSDVPFPALPPPHAKLYLKSNPVPYAMHTPIPVAHHFRAEVKAMLDRDVGRGIIIPVPVNTPVVWCAPMVVVTKPDGTPRRTIDYQHLNSQCLRQTHYTHSPFNLASRIPPNTKKTVIDAVDGFHSVEVDEESRHLLIFITEWGRYMPLRLPQGYSASGDAYTHRTDNITKDVERKLKIVDDSLLYDNTIEESFYHTWDYLTTCAENGIVANLKKFQFCQDTVEFAGLTITPSGIVPSAKMLSAMRNFPSPTDLTGARSWFGLVNQVAWAYSLSPVMAPFREIIKPNSKFYWDDSLEKIFQSSKETIVNLVIDGVQSYNVTKRTCIQSDWSKDGLGYVLLQKHCECTDDSPVCCKDGWKLIFAGSRFTKPAETRYSPTEGEALALAWSLDHSRMYTLGCNNLLAAVDHKPLLGIFNHRNLGDIKKPRMQSIKESTLAWRFSIVHCPGKWTRAPDALSRQRIASSLVAIREEPSELDDERCATASTDSQVAGVYAINGLASLTWDDVCAAGRSDSEYQDLLAMIKSGFPSKRNLTEPAHLREFWEVRNRLSDIDGVAMMDKRIVTPRLLRKVALDNLHSANQGVTGMRFRACQCIYWPGLDACIRNHRDTCIDCIKNAPSQSPEPLILTPSPNYPFEKICADYFNIDNHVYLNVVDRFSGWLCLYHAKTGEMNSTMLVKIFRDLFVAYGAPEELSSDGGPQFTGKIFTDFLKNWGIKHRLSSVAYPQSNGRAELAVKAGKRIIHNNVSSDGSLNNDNAARAVLQYRNTPLPDIKLSPAQILLHRNLRDSMPAHPDHYHLNKNWVISAKDREEAFAKRNEILIRKYDAHVRELPPLAIGTDVVVQSKMKGKRWDRRGKIVETLPHRQYRIRMCPSGRITLQNRRFIREFTAIKPPTAQILPSGLLTTSQSAHQHEVQAPPPPTRIPSPPQGINVDAHRDDNLVIQNNVEQEDAVIIDECEIEPEAPPMLPGRLPRALRNIQDFNEPGLKEGGRR